MEKQLKIRGGRNNIHSWTIGIKGEILPEQNELMELLLRERRKNIGQKRLE